LRPTRIRDFTMKKIFYEFIGMTFVLGIFAGCISCSISGIKGNGNLKTLERPVSAFEKITCAGAVEVRFHAGETYRAIVTVDENLDEYVEIYTKNNVLNIGTKKGHSYSFTKFWVDVYSPVLTSVSINGSGSFEGIDKIAASTFESNISGSGKIEGTIESDHFSATISGSGKITFAGASKDANIDISGSGDFNGNELNVKNATVNISGSGTANIYADDNLQANIAGSGNINYRGEAKIDSKIAGSGRIKNVK